MHGIPVLIIIRGRRKWGMARLQTPSPQTTRQLTVSSLRCLRSQTCRLLSLQCIVSPAKLRPGHGNIVAGNLYGHERSGKASAEGKTSAASLSWIYLLVFPPARHIQLTN